jgi:membrane associated rhomboid family serine protease
MGALITCQKCRALLDSGARQCPYCGTDQRHQLAPSESEDAVRTTRFGLWILGVILGLYALMVLLDPAAADRERGSLKPSGLALVMFGWAERDLVHACGQYWRLLASMFLHADLLHLLLNSIALYYLIPIASQTFGVYRTVCLYFASGLCGAGLSTAVGNSGLGASGALCGLIAAAAVYGWRRGGSLGRALSRGMLSWGAIIVLYGIVMWQTVDNAGHIGGFLGGAALGWLAAAVRARGGPGDRAWALAARLLVVAALGAGALFWAPFVLRGFDLREIDLYYRQAGRTLGLLAAPGTEALPETFPDGPRGSEAVRDDVRRALALARTGDPGARAALDHAVATFGSWSRGLYCSHGFRPLK